MTSHAASLLIDMWNSYELDAPYNVILICVGGQVSLGGVKINGEVKWIIRPSTITLTVFIP